MKSVVRKIISASFYVVVLNELLSPISAWARLGGGHTFSGGHGGGGYGGGLGGNSYGGSGGGVDLLYIVMQLFGGLIRLNFEHPSVGIPLTLFILWIIFRLFNQSESNYAFHPGEHAIDGIASVESGVMVDTMNPVEVQHRIEQLQITDPNFSEPLFLDFCAGLYSTVHQARGKKKLDQYSGYLSQEVRNQLISISENVIDVEGVVVGGITVAGINPEGTEETRIIVHFEANYTETRKVGEKISTQSCYSREEWVFSRKKGLLSRTPEKVRTYNCPACGAPAQGTAEGMCKVCGNVIESGFFDWYVVGLECSRESRPDLLSAEVAEEGTDLPTVYDPYLDQQRKLFYEAHPEFNGKDFEERALKIFAELQKAWTERDWNKARPYETDALFQSHLYWIQEYKKQHLINVVDHFEKVGAVVVKIRRDKFYDAITIRIGANSTDYTCRDGTDPQHPGKDVVVGSSHATRRFTEYWTFIRGRSPKPKKDGDFSNCPSCGALLKVNMTGNCEYCHALVSSGDFDWTLSRIEQDEAYHG